MSSPPRKRFARAAFEDGTFVAAEAPANGVVGEEEVVYTFTEELDLCTREGIANLCVVAERNCVTRVQACKSPDSGASSGSPSANDDWAIVSIVDNGSASASASARASASESECASSSASSYSS